MEKAKKIVILFIAIILILIPMPAADVLVKVHFVISEDEANIIGEKGDLYYSTSDMFGFSAEQCVRAEVDEKSKQLTFRLDKNIENQLKGLRLDLPGVEGLVCIDNITISSAGIVQKQFNPCEFLSDDNRIFVNNIETISLVESRKRAYIDVNGVDPYIVLSEGIVEEVNDCYSHFVLTRIGICIFVLGAWFLAKNKNKLFVDKE